MKVLMGLVGVGCLLAAAGSALGDVPCQKCTHDMQVQYRKCIQSGKAQETCTKEEQETAQICVAICNPKPIDPASRPSSPLNPGVLSRRYLRPDGAPSETNACAIARRADPTRYEAT
jgi:hypothetical protein